MSVPASRRPPEDVTVTEGPLGIPTAQGSLGGMGWPPSPQSFLSRWSPPGDPGPKGLGRGGPMGR